MKLSNTNLNKLNKVYQMFLIVLFIISSPLYSARPYEIAKLATADEVAKSIEVFKEWTTSYQNKDYKSQFNLVHPRIQKYKKNKIWKRTMSKSLRRNGSLMSYDILAVAATTPDKIPCTERGHCYRKDMQVVIILLNSRYKKIGDKNKEYVIMANSEDGWRYGGGTFLNIPFGETMGILDRHDEKRYEYKGIERSNGTTY